MKKRLVSALALLLALTCTLPASAADGAPYSVVSAVINREYDFDVDFAPWVRDDMSPGDTIDLEEPDPDVTLTLQNNATGETFVYEPTADTAWYLRARTATLPRETVQMPAELQIFDLGGGYGITDVIVPVTVTVRSSPEAALRQKYFDVTNGLSTEMTEGVDFTVDDASADDEHPAAVTILRAPARFRLDLYDFEAGETVSYYGDDARFTFADVTELGYYSQTDDTFYFDLPGKLVLDDGYELEFTVRVHAIPSNAAENGVPRSVATGDPLLPAGIAALLISGVTALAAVLLRRSRNDPA